MVPPARRAAGGPARISNSALCKRYSRPLEAENAFDCSHAIAAVFGSDAIKPAIKDL